MINNKFSLVFPGQGSQTVGMLADFATQFSEVKITFDEASTALNYDLWQLIQQGPAEKLDQTIHTQPALLAASYAIWRIIQARTSLSPALLAGHSLGEYTALLCANALDFATAIRLVAARGQFMQEAVPPGMGAMAAIIGLEESDVADVCRAAKISSEEVLSPANFNSIGQIVIAGHKAAVLRAMQLAKEKGARLTLLIPVSVPSHCKLMEGAAERLAAFLAQINLKKPEIPILNNVDAAFYQDENAIREGLIRQLSKPVRWVEIIQEMPKIGITHVVECGPGKILTGLNKRIDKNLQFLTTSDLASLEALLKLESEKSA